MVDDGDSQQQNHDDLWAVTWKFEDESFDTLKTCAEEHRYKPGEAVFREGDPPDGMYLVLEGAALIVRKTSHGEERTVARERIPRKYNLQSELKLEVPKARGSHEANFNLQ